MNTPVIRVSGPSGSGRSAIACALQKLLLENGITCELISSSVELSSTKLSLKMLLQGKLLPIIVSPNRPGDDVPPVMELLKELAVARKSAQDTHKRCQQAEAKLARAEADMDERHKRNNAYKIGWSAAARQYSDQRTKLREEFQKEFDRKLAAYKDATRSELKALRHGACPLVFVVAHETEHGNTNNIVLSHHKPSEAEVREACGYPPGGKVVVANMIAPLIPPKTK